MVFEKDARVQALASLFYAGTEDAQGRTYSQKRKANSLGDYCLGTITRVYRGARNTEQKYMVKWDEGTSTALVERHLAPAEGTVGSTVTHADDEASGLSDFLPVTEMKRTTRTKMLIMMARQMRRYPNPQPHVSQ
jgi:hypothetical protein